MNVQTIVFDMDGTILNSKKELDGVLREISPLLKEQGKQLLIATGRLAQMTYIYLNELELNDEPLISCNGALIDYRQKGDQLFAAKFPLETVTSLVERAQELGLLFHLFTTKGMLGTEHAGRLAYYNEANESKATEDRVPILVGDEYMTPEYLKETIKFLIVASPSKEVEEFRAYASSLGLEVVNSGDNLIDITLKGITKGSALKRLHDAGFLNLETTMAFGDNDNDVSMLEVVKYPIAMGNGTEAAKARAIDICGVSDENGVGVYLKQKFL